MCYRQRMYTYNASVLRVLDGDTVELMFDLGFHVKIAHICRLHGINAPEKNTPEGKAAKAFLEALLPVATYVVAQTVKDKQEKFGRILVQISYNEKAVIPQIIESGHAKPWDGKGTRPV